MPGSHNFVITPVSPHNLTARPIIVPDDSEITLKIGGRSKNCMVSLDSRSLSVDKKTELRIKKADFVVKLVRLQGSSYFETIRQKLSWGVDIRN